MQKWKPCQQRLCNLHLKNTHEAILSLCQILDNKLGQGQVCRQPGQRVTLNTTGGRGRYCFIAVRERLLKLQLQMVSCSSMQKMMHSFDFIFL